MPCLALDLTSLSPLPNSVSIHPIQEVIIGLPSIAFSSTLAMSLGTQTQIGLGILETITLFLDMFSLWLEQLWVGVWRSNPLLLFLVLRANTWPWCTLLRKWFGFNNSYTTSVFHSLILQCFSSIIKVLLPLLQIRLSTHGWNTSVFIITSYVNMLKITIFGIYNGYGTTWVGSQSSGHVWSQAQLIESMLQLWPTLFCVTILWWASISFLVTLMNTHPFLGLFRDVQVCSYTTSSPL